MIEKITDKDEVLAIILRNNFKKDGVSFFTPDNFSQQLAFMKHPKGKIIEPHIHNPIQREIFFTKEVLFLKKGCLRVDFYTQQKKYLESRTLNEGDTVLLASGGHGFEVLEEIEMIEVKQGPFAGNLDKIRFEGIQADKAYLNR